MAATLIVNSATLRSKANELRNLNSRFNSACDELQSQESTMSKMWKGESWNEFHNYFSKNRKEFNDFYQGIQTYIKALEEAADRYERMERQNKTTAKGI